MAVASSDPSAIGYWKQKVEDTLVLLLASWKNDGSPNGGLKW